MPKCKAAQLTPQMFGKNLAPVYLSAEALHNDGKHVNEESLMRKGLDPRLFLFDVIDNPSWRINQHIQELVDEHKSNLLKSAFSRAEAYIKDEDPESAVKYIEESIKDYKGLGHDDSTRHISDSVMDFCSHMADLYKKDPSQRREEVFETPFYAMNSMMRGYERETLNIIAGCPGSGKTVMGSNLSCFMSFKGKLNTLFMSAELTERQLLQRLACSQAGVDSHRLKDCMLNDDELSRMQTAMQRMKEAPFYINDKKGITAEYIEAAVIRHKNRRPLDVLVIDHFHRLRFNTKSGSLRRDVMNDAAILFKDIASQHKICVILLCQLNRSSINEGRDPHKGDLKEASGLEENADTIMFLRNMGVMEDQPDPLTDKVKCIVAKNRQGPEGDFHLPFKKNFFRFLNT